MIRQALPEEYSILIQNELDQFDSDWITLEDFDTKTAIVLVDQGEIVGHYMWYNDDQPYLYTLLINSKHRGKGYSKLLLKHFLDVNNRDKTLHTNTENIAAINLYSSFGFCILQRELNFYEDGSDAFFMKRTHENTI